MDDVYSLSKTLLDLLELQKMALLEGRYDEAVAIQEMRHNIVDRIQKVDIIYKDNNPDGKNVPHGEDFSILTRDKFREILTINEEIRQNIITLLDEITNRLDAVKKAKAFCNTLINNKDGTKVDFSA